MTNEITPGYFLRDGYNPDDVLTEEDAKEISRQIEKEREEAIKNLRKEVTDG